jgi:hypothetical protein
MSVGAIPTLAATLGSPNFVEKSSSSLLHWLR